MFKHWFPCLLPVFLALDLLLPFLFAIPYRGYSHLTQVMSVLGNPKAPLHILYDLWLVALGAAILCSAPRLYALVAKASPAIGAALLFVLAAYAVGGCILSGIFPVGEGKTLETLAAKIHGYGSVIGFLLLTFAPLLAGLYFFKASNGALGVFSLVCFVLALVFFTLFIMADKPRYQAMAVALEGLWQRLTLLSMYLPVAALCLLPE